jgi:polyhydroxyalkanoate synthesis regulator phasin
MKRRLKRKVAAGVAAGLAVAGGGAAIAATRSDSPSETSGAVVNDAAKQLGVQPSALSAALKRALENRVDEAVAAGRLTREEGDAIKARIESGEFPIFGGGPRAHVGHLATLDAAATYLGLTEAELRSRLEGGKTLAEVAEDQGKSVDGLVQALTDEATKRLDAAVAAGRLTKEQEQSILADLKEHLTDLVNGRHEHDADGDRPGLRPAGPEF